MSTGAWPAGQANRVTSGLAMQTLPPPRLITKLLAKISQATVDPGHPSPEWIHYKERDDLVIVLDHVRTAVSGQQYVERRVVKVACGSQIIAYLDLDERLQHPAMEPFRREGARISLDQLPLGVLVKAPNLRLTYAAGISQKQMLQLKFIHAGDCQEMASIFERMGLPVRAASTSDRPDSQRLKTAGSLSATPPSSQTRNTWSSHGNTSSQTVRPVEGARLPEEPYLGVFAGRGVNAPEAVRASTAVSPSVSMGPAAFSAPFARSPLSQRPMEAEKETPASYSHASQIPAHVPVYTAAGHPSGSSSGSQTRVAMVNHIPANSGMVQHRTPATEPQSIYQAEHGRINNPSERVSTATGPASQYISAPSPQRKDVYLPQLSTAALLFPPPSHSAPQPRPWTTHGSGDMAPPPVPDRFWAGQVGSGGSQTRKARDAPVYGRRITRLAVKNAPDLSLSQEQHLHTAVPAAPAQPVEMPPRRELPFETPKTAMQGIQPTGMAPLDSQTVTIPAPQMEGPSAVEQTVVPSELSSQPVLDPPPTPSPSKAKPRAKRARVYSPKKKPTKATKAPAKGPKANGPLIKKTPAPRKGRGKNAKKAESQETGSPVQESQVITITDSPETSIQAVASYSQAMESQTMDYQQTGSQAMHYQPMESQAMDIQPMESQPLDVQPKSSQLDFAMEKPLHQSPVLPPPTVAYSSSPPVNVAPPSFDTFSNPTFAGSSFTTTSHPPQLTSSPIATIPELSPHWSSPSPLPSSSPHLHPHHTPTTTTITPGMTANHSSPPLVPSMYPPPNSNRSFQYKNNPQKDHQFPPITPHRQHQQPSPMMTICPRETLPNPPTPEPLTPTPPNTTTNNYINDAAVATVREVDLLKQQQHQHQGEISQGHGEEGREMQGQTSQDEKARQTTNGQGHGQGQGDQREEILGRAEIERIFDQRFQEHMSSLMGRVGPYMAQVNDNLRKIEEAMGWSGLGGGVTNDEASS
ncbi:MAG: hypothetical protein M1823_006013 [Watsoniomyces obsoletus]|nr:MAG: hypothetical protein M1823_006013 [Watsoniomyces obsoletus]